MRRKKGCERHTAIGEQFGGNAEGFDHPLGDESDCRVVLHHRRQKVIAAFVERVDVGESRGFIVGVSGNVLAHLTGGFGEGEREGKSVDHI